jgi:uncharacterized membrane protein HdeD (DUF308 family)
MSQKNVPTVRAIRIGLIVTGLGMLAVGLVCIIAPYWFATPLEWIVGGAMSFAGLAGGFHLVVGFIASLIGRWRRTPKRDECKQDESVVQSILTGSSASAAERGPVWTIVLLQLMLGGAILMWPQIMRPYLLFILLLAIAAEGGLILWASFHFSSLSTKVWMWLSGLLSIAVAVVAMLQWGDPNAAFWLGAMIGAKFLMLGLIFVGVGLRASESDLRCAYVGLASFQDQADVGSIYAVYYGPAFHCGIGVGDGQIVDYLTDGIVRLITWEEFLLGRRAMEWNYPDVIPGDPEQIAQFARGLAGKYNKYDALKFNCENLAIYCRSVGQTTHSSFSQAAVGVEFVRRKPVLGSMVQLLNRGASWFLYGAGGPFGKKIGFTMIRIARALTDWVVARPMRLAEEFSSPSEVYMPRFEERGTKS